MNSEIVTALLAGVKPALIALVYMVAAKYAVSVVTAVLLRLHGAIDELQAKMNENKWLRLTKLDDYLMERLALAVEGVRDSYTDALKAAAADGKLTKEEAKQATEKAWQTFKDSLSDIELQELVAVFGADLERIVKNRIPGLVAMLKDGGGEADADKEAVDAEAPFPVYEAVSTITSADESEN